MPTQRIIYAKQRALICRAFLDGLKCFSMAYTGRWEVGDHSTDIAIGCSVVLGQAEGRLMSISDIAGYTGIARSTVKRKIGEMELAGIVATGKSGRRTVVWINHPNSPEVVHQLEAVFTIAKNLSAELSKLDSKPIAPESDAG